jgi:serine/threonine protein kinase/HAMP domain-containing protein
MKPPSPVTGPVRSVHSSTPMPQARVEEGGGLRKLGRYEIRDCIGRGAMANVYRAFDPNINRVLAIKVLKREFLQDRQYTARFLREAKAAGALSHPNIVTIFDVGEEDGYPYIAMELLTGDPLDSVTRGGERLAAAQVAEIGLQLAEALNYAHGVGVIHRDVKPSNIMLSHDSRAVKLLDFGIAWLAPTDGGADEPALRTQIGEVLGTPRYMSPEQALGEETDRRTDLFSVGVVLYELVTGRRAFDGANPATLALQITQADPAPIAKLAPDCPSGLQFIINKLLSKRPERRFASGAQLVEALRREIGNEAPAVSVRRALPLPVRMSLMMGTITAVVLLVSIGGVLHRQDEAMRRMAISSGTAITAFIANSAALTAADNATLPADQRDWMPVEAFVKSITDPNIEQITVVDDAGIVRASTRAADLGRPYHRPSGEQVVSQRDGLVVADQGRAGDAFRFVRPITYAGHAFGRIDVSVNKADLNEASQLSRMLLGLLGIVTLGAVLAVSFAAARAMAAPVRRLKLALKDAGSGDFDFRISHRRRDEFGDLFDAFNRLAAEVQTRLEAAEADRGQPARGTFAPNHTAARVVAALDSVARLDDGAGSALVLTLGRRHPTARPADLDDGTRIGPPTVVAPPPAMREHARAPGGMSSGQSSQPVGLAARGQP